MALLRSVLVVLLLWIFYVFFLSCVCNAIVRVCLFVPCGHLPGKGYLLALVCGVELKRFIDLTLLQLVYTELLAAQQPPLFV